MENKTLTILYYLKGLYNTDDFTRTVFGDIPLVYHFDFNTFGYETSIEFSLNLKNLKTSRVKDKKIAEILYI